MNWLALMIGNSRLHWGWFQGEILKVTWHTQHLSQPLIKGNLPKELFPSSLPNLENSPLYLASVVPQQTDFWQTYPLTKLITLQQIPLVQVYPTMGLDRALAVWGMGTTYGFPCLVIDAGTALTFTGVTRDKKVRGGAILPGLRLQFQSLASKTAALPEVSLPQHLPVPWALTTPEAISSGIIYTTLAGIREFIQDWLGQFPDSNIGLTGGDSGLLMSYLASQYPEIATRLTLDENLIFWGIREIAIS
jgi:type III pantothenate kinase